MLNDPRVWQLLAAERVERLRADAAPTPAAGTSRRRPLRSWLALAFRAGAQRPTRTPARPTHSTP
jgi:hypothetical protein